MGVGGGGGGGGIKDPYQALPWRESHLFHSLTHARDGLSTRFWYSKGTVTEGMRAPTQLTSKA